MNNIGKYYRLAEPDAHTGWCSCNQIIFWNTEEIATERDANGFILQEYKRALIPEDALDIEDYKTISYYEAWMVENGTISSEDAGVGGDDFFSIGRNLDTFSQFYLSIGTKGRFEFTGAIYWLPVGTELYSIVKNWPRGGVHQAGNLRSSYVFDEIKTVAPVFKRTPFIHEWDMSNQEKVYSVAKSALFKYCPNNTDTDRHYLNEGLETLFHGEYPILEEQIKHEWELQWQ